MKTSTPTKRQIEIEELEKKYYLEILDLLKKNEKYIKEMFQTFRERYKFSKASGMHYGKENPLDIAMQELVRSILYRQKPEWLPFMLAIASDTAFVTEDAILQTDVKTVKSGDQRGDDKDRIQVHPNQSSYSGNIEAGGTTYHFKGNLPTIMEEKITLTYFIRFLWSFDKDGLPQIDQFTLSSIPNGELNNQYPNLIHRIKTYFYESDKTPAKIKSKFGSDPSDKEKRLIKKETEDARLEFQNKFGYSADTTLISVEDKLSKPKLTEDWKRFTEVFSW